MRVLAQDDDSDVWLRRGEVLRYADALVGSRRRHPHIRDDDIRPGLLNRSQKRRLVVCNRYDVYVRRGVEDLHQHVADRDGVIREYDADRHGLLMSIAPLSHCGLRGWA